MASTKALTSGAIRAAPAVGGSLLLGPVLGPVAGGFAADTLTDGSGSKFTTMGAGISAAMLLSGAGGGSRSTERVM